MDPNTALARLRELCRQEDPDGAELSEHVEALDGWLTSGGFLPEAWGTRGVCGAQTTDLTGAWTHRYVCSKPPHTGGVHEDETRGAKWHTEPTARA